MGDCETESPPLPPSPPPPALSSGRPSILLPPPLLLCWYVCTYDYVQTSARWGAKSCDPHQPNDVLEAPEHMLAALQVAVASARDILASAACPRSRENRRRHATSCVDQVSRPKAVLEAPEYTAALQVVVASVMKIVRRPDAGPPAGCSRPSPLLLLLLLLLLLHLAPHKPLFSDIYLSSTSHITTTSNNRRRRRRALLGPWPCEMHYSKEKNPLIFV